MVTRLFVNNSFVNFKRDRLNRLTSEINNLARDVLLNTDENELYDSFASRYQLTTPVLKLSDKFLYPSEESSVITTVLGNAKSIMGTKFAFGVPFEGNLELFRLTPSTIIHSVASAGFNDNVMNLEYVLAPDDKDKLTPQFEEDMKLIETNLSNLKKDIDIYNAEMEQLITNTITGRRNKLLADDDFMESLNIPIMRKPEDKILFAPPRKKRQFNVNKPKTKIKFDKPEPTLKDPEYEYILEVLQKMSEVIERNPYAFSNLDEEDIRTHFLLMLNGHYEVMPTGETFNFAGKTDILMPYKGRNVFIAECKFWRGPKEFLDTINQLLSYTSWRDTKTAILIFNRNKSHSSVLNKIIETTPSHECFVKEIISKDETVFRYIFHKPNDKLRLLNLAILTFDFPKLNTKKN